VLEVLHQALHVPQLSLQLDLLVAQAVLLSAQMDVSFGGQTSVRSLMRSLASFTASSPRSSASAICASRLALCGGGGGGGGGVLFTPM
ncbi:hypothetical protein CRUP_014952, partial [Coryphaenoides rupestris]